MNQRVWVAAKRINRSEVQSLQQGLQLLSRDEPNNEELNQSWRMSLILSCGCNLSPKYSAQAHKGVRILHLSRASTAPKK